MIKHQNTSKLFFEHDIVNSDRKYVTMDSETIIKNNYSLKESREIYERIR